MGGPADGPAPFAPPEADRTARGAPPGHARGSSQVLDLREELLALVTVGRADDVSTRIGTGMQDESAVRLRTVATEFRSSYDALLL